MFQGKVGDTCGTGFSCAINIFINNILQLTVRGANHRYPTLTHNRTQLLLLLLLLLLPQQQQLLLLILLLQLLLLLLLGLAIRLRT